MLWYSSRLSNSYYYDFELIISHMSTFMTSLERIVLISLLVEHLFWIYLYHLHCLAQEELLRRCWELQYFEKENADHHL